MRIMVRIMGLTIIGLCVSIMLMHSFDINVRYDELEKISSIAMSNTQIVMMENIEDNYYGTNNSRLIIKDDKDYEQIYIDNLNKLVSTNSKYIINECIADSRKGLLYVDLSCEFVALNGETKTINKKLLNIVDVVEHEKDI